MTDGETLRAGRTDRWRGLAGATLLAAAAGLLTQSPGLVLVAGVGTVLLAYGRLVSPPEPTLSVERSFDPADPTGDEPVTVELVVENVGERTLSDVRVADGVPDGLRVTDGDDALGTSLRPGAAATLTYEVVGSRRQYEFDPVTVALRDVTGIVERRVRVSAEGAVGWGADPSTEPTITPQQSLLPGLLGVDEGGEGVAFHAVREYRPRDPLRRIDWRRRARTGEFATVEYQRERAATVVLAVDTRAAAALAPGSDAPTAIDRSVDAAAHLVDALADAGHRVGVASLSPPAVLSPSSGERHRRRCHDRLASPTFGHADEVVDDTAVDGAVADGIGGRADGPTDTERVVTDGGAGSTADDDVDGLLARLPASGTVVLFTPLCDPGSGAAARRLAAHGYDVTVLSPDPTATGTTGQRLARLERCERLRQLRSRGVSVLDWQPGEPLAAALTTAGWST